MKSKPRRLPILLLAIILLLASIVPACSQPQGIPPQDWTVANETEFLAKCEQSDITFERCRECGDTIVYTHRRMIGDVLVENDFIAFHFHPSTGMFKAKYSHWRDDLPETAPPIDISKEQAEAIGNGTEAQLIYIDPESRMFDCAPINPCWTVYVYEDVYLPEFNKTFTQIVDVVVVDAVTGEIVGHIVTTP